MTETTVATPDPKSWKVACKTGSDANWSYSAMRYARKEDAEEAGRSLFSRWTALKEWEAHPSNDEPNA